MIQIDMEMPKSCKECSLPHIIVNGNYCYSSCSIGRPAWCPLHEVTEDPDTVSRQAVISTINNLHDKPNAWLDHAVDAVKALPPSPTQSRPKGHWIKGKMWSEGIGMGETYGFYYTCSKCNSSVKGGYDECRKNFCEKCGADMRGTEHE